MLVARRDATLSLEGVRMRRLLLVVRLPALVAASTLFVASVVAAGSGATEVGDRSVPPWRIVYTSDDPGFRGRRGLGVLSWEKSRPQVLVRSPVEDIWSLAWAPDGRQVAYTIMIPTWVKSRSEQRRRGLYSVSLGGAVRHLTTAFDEGGAWSPDSRWIAFSRITVIQRGPAELPLVREALYIVPSRGGKPRLVFPGCGAPASTVGTWSPDGKRLVVFCGSALWVVDANGSARRRLSRREDGELGGPPVWSPDGRLIAYGSRCYETRGGNDVWCYVTLIRPDGRAKRTLSGVLYDGSPLVWSAEGTLVFNDWSQDDAPLVAVDPRSGARRTVRSRFGVYHANLTAGSNGTIGLLFLLGNGYLEVFDANGKRLLHRKLPSDVTRGSQADLWLG